MRLRSFAHNKELDCPCGRRYVAAFSPSTSIQIERVDRAWCPRGKAVVNGTPGNQCGKSCDAVLLYPDDQRVEVRGWKFHIQVHNHETNVVTTLASGRARDHEQITEEFGSLVLGGPKNVFALNLDDPVTLTMGLVPHSWLEDA